MKIINTNCICPNHGRVNSNNSSWSNCPYCGEKLKLIPKPDNEILIRELSGFYETISYALSEHYGVTKERFKQNPKRFIEKMIKDLKSYKELEKNEF